MNTLRILYHLSKADLLERTRRYSFLITLGSIIYLGYMVNTGELRLELDHYQGELNSAWVGGVMATMTVFFLSLFGFFLVKNAIQRDEHTGVGQIIATTPLNKILYIFGKIASNFLFLIVAVAILILAAVAMQVIEGSGFGFDLGVLLSPFVGIVLPALLITSALAVFFETIPWLRGAAGSVIYFAVWLASLILAFENSSILADWSGISILWQSMATAVRSQFPDYIAGFNITFTPASAIEIFRWDGVAWTTELVLGRLLWVGVAVVIGLLAALFFNRFDPSRERPRRQPAQAPQAVPELEIDRQDAGPVRLSTLDRSSFTNSPARVLLAELRLLLKGQRWWWYAIMLGIILGGLFSPAEDVRRGWLPAAWLWPLAIWSSLGTRDARYRTSQIVFSSARPLLRQFPAAWLASVLVTMLAGSGAAITLMRSGAWAGLIAWLAGALFIPSLAMALGIWSGSSKIFEVVYIILWYIGPMHPLDSPRLDFMGAGDASIAAGVPIFFLLAALLLLALSAAGRWRQIRA